MVSSIRKRRIELHWIWNQHQELLLQTLAASAAPHSAGITSWIFAQLFRPPSAKHSHLDFAKPTAAKAASCEQIHPKKLSLAELMAYSNSLTLWTGFSRWRQRPSISNGNTKTNTASAEFINFNSALSQTASLVIIDKTSIGVHISEQITKKHW